MSAIKMELDGTVYDLTDLDWVCIAPCGCWSGVITTGGVHGMEPRVTESQAWADYSENAVERQRDQAAGFRMQLITHEEFRNTPWGKGQHEPRWGVPRAVMPVGHAWMVSSWLTAPSRQRRHVVPVNGDGSRTSLCGRATSEVWTDGPFTEPFADCGRCLNLITPKAETTGESITSAAGGSR